MLVGSLTLLVDCCWDGGTWCWIPSWRKSLWTGSRSVCETSSGMPDNKLVDGEWECKLVERDCWRVGCGGGGCGIGVIPPKWCAGEENPPRLFVLSFWMNCCHGSNDEDCDCGCGWWWWRDWGCGGCWGIGLICVDAGASCETGSPIWAKRFIRGLLGGTVVCWVGGGCGWGCWIGSGGTTKLGLCNGGSTVMSELFICCTISYKRKQKWT